MDWNSGDKFSYFISLCLSGCHRHSHIIEQITAEDILHEWSWHHNVFICIVGAIQTKACHRHCLVNIQMDKCNHKINRFCSCCFLIVAYVSGVGVHVHCLYVELHMYMCTELQASLISDQCLFCLYICSHAGVSHSVPDFKDFTVVCSSVCSCTHPLLFPRLYLFPILFYLPVCSSTADSIVWWTFADARQWKWNKQSMLVKCEAKPGLLIGFIHLYLKAKWN